MRILGIMFQFSGWVIAIILLIWTVGLGYGMFGIEGAIGTFILAPFAALVMPFLLGRLGGDWLLYVVLLIGSSLFIILGGSMSHKD